jgi:hypothetical protein
MKHDDTYYTTHFPEVIDAIARVQRGDAASADAVIRFLEADPYAMGTGYLKEKAWKFLKRVELSEADRERLRRVAIRYLLFPWHSEFFSMCRAISRFADESFLSEVHAHTGSSDNGLVRRAALLSAYLGASERGEEMRKQLSQEYYREKQGIRESWGGGKKPGKPRWKNRLDPHLGLR